ncbi:MAG TPA: phosphate acetyltransferase [Gemmatimonadaceae bacterium]
MSFVERVRARAIAARRSIAFPESSDARTIGAVRTLAAQHIVRPILVLEPGDESARRVADEIGVATVRPLTDGRRARVIAHLLARRAPAGLTRDGAESLVNDPLVFADCLVALGEVDGCVAGAAHTTADVLRAALWAVGPARGVRIVSSAFYMVVPPFRGAGGEHEVLTFTDCAVVPRPTASHLADIAVAAARDRRRIVGDEPRVAFLSYSTLGSGSGASVNTVREAVALLRDPRQGETDFAVDGELQGDAALIEAVARRKAPVSTVAGRANVLVFPSLEAGNIAYKLVERLAHAQAIGPIVQGLAHPCSDLSRGAAIDDIINVAAITALQSLDAGPTATVLTAAPKDADGI